FRAHLPLHSSPTDALPILNAFFKPDWSALSDGSVWVAAYAQIFFSLSIGFAIMITYASYLSKKTDITNNAFIVGFANSSFELLRSEEHTSELQSRENIVCR